MEEGGEEKEEEGMWQAVGWSVQPVYFQINDQSCFGFYKVINNKSSHNSGNKFDHHLPKAEFTWYLSRP